MTTTILLLLFATGLFGGMVDAIAGGGGLISLPVLLSLGIPPHLAIGTSKFQGTIGTLVAAQKYYRHGFISMATAKTGIISGVIGAITGAVLGQILSADILRHIIPVLLFLVFVYTMVSPKLGYNDTKPRMNTELFLLISGFMMGAYDGFFGPGTGSLWVFIITYFLGYNLIKATAYTKVFNLNSSLVASLCFMVGGNVDYTSALCMAAGQLIGGRLGAHLAIKKGAQLIRPIFLSVVSLTIASVVYKTYASSDLFGRITQSVGVMPQVVAASAVLFIAGMIYLRRYLSLKEADAD